MCVSEGRACRPASGCGKRPTFPLFNFLHTVVAVVAFLLLLHSAVVAVVALLLLLHSAVVLW